VFSVPVVFRSKTLGAGNGQSLSSTATQLRDTTGTPEGLDCQHPWQRCPSCKGLAIRYEARLAMNADRPTEHDNITLTEY